MCRRVAVAFLILLLLFAAAVGLVFYMVARPDASVDTDRGVATAPPTAEEVTNAERTVERLERQIEKPKRRARKTDPNAFELRITEEELNDILRSYPEVQRRLTREKVSAPRIRMQRDRVVASARVPITAGLSSRVSIAGRLTVVDGGLAFETESVKLGALPAPPQLREELDKHLESAVNVLNKSIDGRLEEIVQREGSVTVRGTR